MKGNNNLKTVLSALQKMVTELQVKVEQRTSPWEPTVSVYDPYLGGRSNQGVHFPVLHEFKFEKPKTKKASTLTEHALENPPTI